AGRQGPAGERRGDVLTVAGERRMLAAAPSGDESRQPVHRDDRLGALAARTNRAGPADDGRHAQPAFEQLGLLAGERPGVAEPLAPVVAGKDDYRVLIETERGEPFEHSADVVVERL